MFDSFQLEKITLENFSKLSEVILEKILISTTTIMESIDNEIDFKTIVKMYFRDREINNQLVGNKVLIKTNVYSKVDVFITVKVISDKPDFIFKIEMQNLKHEKPSKRISVLVEDLLVYVQIN